MFTQFFWNFKFEAKIKNPRKKKSLLNFIQATVSKQLSVDYHTIVKLNKKYRRIYKWMYSCDSKNVIGRGTVWGIRKSSIYIHRTPYTSSYIVHISCLVKWMNDIYTTGWWSLNVQQYKYNTFWIANWWASSLSV